MKVFSTLDQFIKFFSFLVSYILSYFEISIVWWIYVKILSKALRLCLILFYLKWFNQLTRSTNRVPNDDKDLIFETNTNFIKFPTQKYYKYLSIVLQLIL